MAALRTNGWRWLSRLAAALLVLGAVSACGGGGSFPSATTADPLGPGTVNIDDPPLLRNDDDTLVVAVSRDLLDVDPTLADGDRHIWSALTNVYGWAMDGEAGDADDGAPIDDAASFLGLAKSWKRLAKSWKWDEDGARVTVRLREGLKFPNGDPVTADSMKSTLDRMFDLARTYAPDDHHFKRVDSMTIERVDSMTIEMALDANIYAWLIGEEVVHIGDPDSFVGPLVKSWNWSADRARVMLHLREGLKFSDGSPLTAESVKYTLERMLDQEQQAPDRRQVTLVDSDTIEMTVDAANSLQLVDPAQAGNPLEVIRRRNGQGPYRLESWERGNHYVLVRNGSYRGAPAGIERIVFKVIRDPLMRLEQLLSGALDAAWELPTSERWPLPGWHDRTIGTLEDHPDIVVHDHTTRIIGMIGMNDKVPPFDNALVRQAVSHVIPYGMTVIDQGAGVRSGVPGLVSEGTPRRLDDALRYSLAVDKARSLLEEAGFGDGFETTLHLQRTAPGKDLARLVQQALGRIGVDVDIQWLPETEFVEPRQKDDWGLFFADFWISIRDDPFEPGPTFAAEGGEEIHATFIPAGPDRHGTHYLFPPGVRWDLYEYTNGFYDQAPVMEFGRTLHVGADVAPPIEALHGAGSRGEVSLSQGEVRDGVGATDVLDYLKTITSGQFEGSLAGVQKWTTPPDLQVVGTDTEERYMRLTWNAARIVNAALPFTQRLRLRVVSAPVTEELAKFYRDNRFRDIFVRFVPKTHPLWSGAAGDELGRSRIQTPPPHIFNTERQRWEVGSESGAVSSDVLIDPGAVAFLSDAELTHVLVHELLHAVGLMGHTDPERFDSTLNGEGYFPGSEPRSLIYPIDREGLLAAYSRFRVGTLPEQMTHESLGPWTDTSFHTRGDLELPSGDVAFGVAFRNGLPQPWAFGPTPETDLAGNAALSGTVSWKGALVGMTPSGGAVGGAASLTMDLPRVRNEGGHLAHDVDGELALTAIRYEDGSSWGDGDLAYSIEVDDNGFRRARSSFVRYGPADPNKEPYWASSGEDFGVVTGVFFGKEHEGMGGVLERHDLSAAFAGKR